MLIFFLFIDDPEKDEKIQGNPFNTLFVSRLSYELTESDLMREFEQYGPIKNVKENKNNFLYSNEHILITKSISFSLSFFFVCIYIVTIR